MYSHYTHSAVNDDLPVYRRGRRSSMLVSTSLTPTSRVDLTPPNSPRFNVGSEAPGMIVALPTDPAVLNHLEYQGKCYATRAKDITVRIA